MNVSLIARIDSLIAASKSTDVASASTYLQNEIAKLKSALGYTYEEKKFAQGEQPSEDHMIVSLLSQVVKAVKEEEEKFGKTGDEQGRTDRIVKTLEWHKSRLLQRQEEIKKEKVDIAAEQKKWITSEDIHDGWDSKTASSLALSFLSPWIVLATSVLTRHSTLNARSSRRRRAPSRNRLHPRQRPRKRKRPRSRRSTRLACKPRKQ